MKNKIVILLPFLLALAFACGVWFCGAFKFSGPLPQQPSKISEILQLIEREYVEDINIDSLTNDFLPDLFEKLDPHSSYISSEAYRDLTDPIRGSFEGIGVQFNIQNDTVVIVQVIHGGPSERLNILAGDRIVTVNDTVIAGNGITNEKTVKLLKGPSGTKVKVGIKRNGVEDLIPFEITRGAIPITSIDASYMIDDKTGYVSLNCFSQTTYDEFMEAVSKLRSQGMKNIIVDLRENGGGLLYTVVDLSNEFLEEGDIIVFTKGRNSQPEYYKADGMGTCKDLKIAVLVNEYSASASEIFAGAMQDNSRGIVVGRRTYGKGCVNEDFTLHDSSVIRLTIKKFYTPSGRCIQKPYNGSLTDYDRELVDRYARGELLDADSINFPDSLRYTTRSGKVVYGGGGIMPDVFVPMKEKSYSPLFWNLSSRGIIHNFAFAFSDKHRQILKTQSKDAIVRFTEKNATVEDLLKLAKTCGVEVSEKLNAEEYALAKKFICCYVVRNILSDQEFLELFNSDDATILKALEELEKQEN